MITCPACGAVNPPEARFCMACAAPLVAAPAASEERKVVTTLFCDLVAFTAMSEGPPTPRMWTPCCASITRPRAA